MHLGLRVIYLLMACWVLKASLLGNNVEAKGIFSALALFFLPLVIDYLGFSPVTKMGKFLKSMGLFLSCLALLIPLVGSIADGSVILSQDKTQLLFFDFFTIKLKHIWFASWFWLVLSIADWSVHLSQKEVSEREKHKELSRQLEKQSVIQETIAERAAEYDKMRAAVPNVFKMNNQKPKNKYKKRKGGR